MKLLCRLFGHDPLPIWRVDACPCNPQCIAEVRRYDRTVCSRCWQDLFV